MIPELKRAIIKYVPDYFSWDVERQEQFRVNKPKEISLQIRSYLMAELLGLPVATEEEMEEAEDQFSDAQWTLINSGLLPLDGIGDDYFYLNEHFAEGKSILSFPTLYDFDFADFQFQEECRLRDNENYQIGPYYGSLYLSWARLFVDGQFSYATLSMMAGFIYSELDEFGNDYLNELIPYVFKPGKNHGKQEKEGFFRHDMKKDAGGLEGQLEELTRRFWDYHRSTYDRLNEECAKEDRQEVFIIDTSHEDDPSHHFVFTDKEVLAKIHLKTFLADCREAEQRDHAILFDMVVQEKERMRHFLDEQYADIMANFDPKIVKLRKKNKILFHKDSGLADLLD